jgi:hypothetical protein
MCSKFYLVPIHKWPICPISALREKFYPRNINLMPAVKFFARLDLEQICLFLDGLYLVTIERLPAASSGECARCSVQLSGSEKRRGEPKLLATRNGV